ncbi:MAG TPA: cob(I)yrinic acid a,c-diamide adenosyltransferase [Mesoaciditoga lauensis]|nr:cob(I)yrinic acid a,c-diamide adenosyltransferase [Mesoaciditoga lauensis]
MYVHVYTGNGKGKTTAAIGLAMRAFGAGLHVSFIQFVKGRYTSEMKSFEKLGIEFFQGGRPEFIIGKPAKEDIDAALNTLNYARERVSCGKYDLVILDEINIAVYLKLLTENDVIDLVNSRSERTEIVLTGRYATDRIIEMADLVTEMKEIKHYYTKGVQQRVGIEV